jgi:hypothetical protein
MLGSIAQDLYDSLQRHNLVTRIMGRLMQELACGELGTMPQVGGLTQAFAAECRIVAA